MKIISSVALICLYFTLSACGGDSNDSGSNSDGSSSSGIVGDDGGDVVVGDDGERGFDVVDSNVLDDGFLSFEDFENTVFQSMGSGFENCGVIRLGEVDLPTNICVAEAFSNQIPFAAVYEEQGFDSIGGSALSMDNNLKVSFWHYDSSPCGGGGGDSPECAGIIEADECLNPRLSGIVDVSSEYDGWAGDIFLCENYDE